MRRELNASWGSGAQGETRSCSGVLREHSQVQRGPGAAAPGNLPPAARRAGSSAESLGARSAKPTLIWGVALRAISLFLWDGCEIK